MASVMLERGPISCSSTDSLASWGELRKGRSSFSKDDSWLRLVLSSSEECDMCWRGRENREGWKEREGGEREGG